MQAPDVNERDTEAAEAWKGVVTPAEIPELSVQIDAAVTPLPREDTQPGQASPEPAPSEEGEMSISELLCRQGACAVTSSTISMTKACAVHS